jgi:spermidine/putrescine transport system substrate-binding protein
MGMVLQRNHLDVNTIAEKDLDVVRSQLLAMVEEMAPKTTVTNYKDLPDGTSPLVQAWSGDAVNARNYLPAGADPSILRFWAPSDGYHQADNDLMVVLGAGRSPVAAHLFIDHMLDPDVAVRNFGAIGYQPPQNRITPTAFANLRILADTILEPEYFATAQRTLDLGKDAETRWLAVWKQFRDRV